MKILKLGKNNKKLINNAIDALNNGGAVIYPTETCYGVGVDATNKQAVDKLLRYKKRPEGKAVSIAVSNIEMANKYVKINKTAKNLYKNFLPGPLTVISKSKGKTDSRLEAEGGTVGVRIPDCQLALSIIKAFGKPITATSANAAYKKTPYCIDDVLTNITKKQQKLLDLILDAGKLAKNPPSTVVDTTMDDIKMIRRGEVDLLKAQSYISHSEKQTMQTAKKIMENLMDKLRSNCIIFALQGELGVGKTQFAKGVAKALRIKENVTSPTFILVREYQFNNLAMEQFSHGILYHIDAWRMKEADELLNLGFYKMIKPGNVIVVEWLEKVKEILKIIKNKKSIKVVWIDMEYKNKKTRTINIHYSTI